LLDPADVGADVLKTQLELAFIQPLGPSTELLTLQLLHDQTEPLDLGLGFRQRLVFAHLFCRQLPDQPM
jgi:hypothetical protein